MYASLGLEKANLAAPVAASSVSYVASPFSSRTCRPPSTRLLRKHTLRCTAATDDRIQDTEIEDQVELFMKRQAELESGAAFARTKEPNQVIGADVVPDESTSPDNAQRLPILTVSLLTCCPLMWIA
eukprot:jgi/Chrzof1/5017/Cz15g08200.t1